MTLLLLLGGSGAGVPVAPPDAFRYLHVKKRNFAVHASLPISGSAVSVQNGEILWDDATEILWDDTTTIMWDASVYPRLLKVDKRNFNVQAVLPDRQQVSIDFPTEILWDDSTEILWDDGTTVMWSNTATVAAKKIGVKKRSFARRATVRQE